VGKSGGCWVLRGDADDFICGRHGAAVDRSVAGLLVVVRWKTFCKGSGSCASVVNGSQPALGYGFHTSNTSGL
jgi:hypothetical protein